MNVQPTSPPQQAAASCSDWDAIYRDLLPRVYNYFRFRVGDHALASDLTAITFLKAWRQREQYHHDLGAFSTWVYTIARHTAADYFRAQHPVSELMAAASLPSAEALEETVEQRLEAERLNALLATLPPREREIIALKYGAELTNRAIARLTRLSESNVGTIIYRVVQKLRDQWEDDHD
jgi:RNA polymerase sigma-70 factor (ECF subfamily)